MNVQTQIEDLINNNSNNFEDVLKRMDGETATTLFKMYDAQNKNVSEDAEINEKINSVMIDIISDIYILLMQDAFIISDTSIIYLIKDTQLVRFINAYNINFVIMKEAHDVKKPFLKNACENRNDDDDMDEFGIHNLASNKHIVVFMMFGKRYCYNLFTLLDAIETDSNELRNWIKNPASSNWNESGPYFNMEQFDQGYGGEAGNKRFFKLPIGPTAELYIDEPGILNLLSKIKEVPIHYFDIVEVGKQRLGNKLSSFGISEKHGQNDIVTIYTINPGEPKEPIKSELDNVNRVTIELSNKAKQLFKDQKINSNILHNNPKYIPPALPYPNDLFTEIETVSLNWSKDYYDIFNDPEFVSRRSPKYKQNDLLTLIFLALMALNLDPL